MQKNAIQIDQYARKIQRLVWYASDFDENISTTSVVLSLRVLAVRVPVMTT
jgi:hypothetical protein